MAWIDIALLVILLIYAIIGLSRGFLKSLLKIFSTLATLCVSIFLAKPLSALFESWFGLKTKFGEMLQGSLGVFCTSSQGEAIDNPLMNKFAEILLGQNYWENYSGGVSSSQFLQDFSHSVGGLLNMAIAVVLLVIIFKVVFWLLGKLFKFLTKNRTIGWLERILGFVVGAVQGFASICLFFCVAYLLLPVIPNVGEQVVYLLDFNQITNELYKVVGEFVDGIIIPWII